MNSTVKYIVFCFLIGFMFNGCMMMGIKKHQLMISSGIFNTSEKVQIINTNQIIDQMIQEMITDLSVQNLDINSIAVWGIKSQTAGINVDIIRHKIITQLVELKYFKVVTRQRLDELLKEQNLSLSGTIDEKSAVPIGKLISVEGFIDGYVSIAENQVILSLNLIETKSGQIKWSKTLERIIK